jgi:tetratricopeptide (TPR) repeat protein
MSKGKSSTQSDFDIAATGAVSGSRVRNAVVWLAIFVLSLTIFYLDPRIGFAVVLPLLGLALIVFGLLVAWFVVYRRGLLTWMRLARMPAQLMANGDAKGAEAACAKALARARRFAVNDHRRGLMLCELAMFVKNQGRSTEAIALYEECANILEQNLSKGAHDYFVALNNYAICFIHLQDFAAAQRLLEKTLDLTLSIRNRRSGQRVVLPLAQMQIIQFVMHLNLAFLLMEMGELAEAELQLRDADALLALISQKTIAAWSDHYFAICALWEFESGKFAEAEAEIAQARNADFPSCLSVRARLHLVRQEFAQAEALIRKYRDLERKKGTLHRPELLRTTLDLAECEFALAKREEAFATLAKARAIVADFALPADNHWREAMRTWVARARDQGKADLAAEIEANLRALPALVSPGITISEKFRAQRET